MTDFHLDGLTGRYRDQPVLGPFDLTLRRNEVVALVGSSGAGKSTLLSVLYQRLPHEVALLPQNLGLVEGLSVFHNVYIGRLDQHRWWQNLRTLIRPSRRQIAEIAPILEQLSLQEKIWVAAAELSGGQQQRVGVARALYQNQSVLLADEPVSALDPPRARSVLEAIRQRYSTAVIALHDVDLALEFSDRIIGLRDGQIFLDETVNDSTR